MAMRSMTIGGGSCIIAVGGIIATIASKGEQSIPRENRGNIFVRMGEIIGAMYTSRHMADPSLAQKHVDLMASLSSVVATKRAKSIAEAFLAERTYDRGYITTALRIHQQRTPVFLFTRHLPPNIPIRVPFLDNAHTGFISAGSTQDLFDENARKAIKAGFYEVCPIPMERFCTPSFPEDRRTIEVVVARDDLYEDAQKGAVGSSCSKCHALQREFLSGLAKIAAASESSLPVKPYGNIAVLTPKEGRFEEAGTLHTMSPSVREQIISGQFTPCKSFGEHGAIIAGRNERNLCASLRNFHPIQPQHPTS